MLLAGDVGGTKTNLAIFSSEAGWRVPVAEATFPSAQYPMLYAVVQEFLQQRNSSVGHSAEGGHADFAPTNAFQIELLRYLLARFPHVSFERVCSGKGVPNIYSYLKDTGYAEEPQWLA